jgi:hypothetical protein
MGVPRARVDPVAYLTHPVGDHRSLAGRVIHRGQGLDGQGQQVYCVFSAALLVALQSGAHELVWCHG